jgi:hypothetical protein
MPMSNIEPPPASAFSSRHLCGGNCGLALNPWALWTARIAPSSPAAMRRLRLAVGRLEVDAVGDAELAVVGLRRGDHPLALGAGRGHRLFAQHVLAGLERAHRVLGVEADREDDVDAVDLAVVLHRVVVGVVVEPADAVPRAEVARLGGLPETNAVMRAWRASMKPGIASLIAKLPRPTTAQRICSPGSAGCGAASVGIGWPVAVCAKARVAATRAARRRRRRAGGGG